MSLLFWALTIGVIGKVLLAVGVLMAHTEIAHEHRIDAKVIQVIKVERVITIVGIALILIGYFLEVYFYGYTPLLTCVGDNCAAALNAAFSQ